MDAKSAWYSLVFAATLGIVGGVVGLWMGGVDAFLLPALGLFTGLIAGVVAARMPELA